MWDTHSTEFQRGFPKTEIAVTLVQVILDDDDDDDKKMHVGGSGFCDEISVWFSSSSPPPPPPPPPRCRPFPLLFALICTITSNEKKTLFCFPFFPRNNWLKLKTGEKDRCHND